MKMLIASSMSIFVLSGCAGVFDAMTRDPVRVEKISGSKDDVIATVSLSAEKRNVVIALQGNKKGSFCAEPPPEVAKAFDIDRSVTLDASLSEEQQAKLKAEQRETTKEAITILGQRTVLLDVYRTGTYSLCQFYVNGAISEADLVKEFTKLTDNVIKALSPLTAN